jgi:ribosomal protein S8
MPSNIYSGIAGVSRACKGSQLFTSMPYSRNNIKLCLFLFRRRWISGYSFSSDGFIKSIHVTYSHHENNNVCSNIIIRSSPGHRTFCSYNRLLNLCSKGTPCYYVLSTSKGLLSSDEALLFGIGGELLMQIMY